MLKNQKMSQKQKDKIRQSGMGKNLGKKWTLQQRKKILDARTNKIRKKKTLTSNGYVRIFAPDHPNCGKSKYILEHRLIIEKYLGRYLEKNEVVHHINNIRTDNRRENLSLFKNESSHAKHHHPKQEWSSKYKKCRICQKTDYKHNAHGLCRHCYHIIRKIKTLSI